VPGGRLGQQDDPVAGRDVLELLLEGPQATAAHAGRRVEEVQVALVGQLGLRELVRGRERVARRKRDEARLGEQRRQPQSVRDHRRADEADVDRAGGDEPLLVVPLQAADVDGHLRPALAERPDDRGRDDPRTEPHDEPSAPAVGAMHAPHRLVRRAHQWLRVLQQLLAGRRQRDPAPVALQQGDTELLLERGDLAAQRGLADAQLLRGSAKAQPLGHRHEVPQAPKVEVHTREAS
jgi:hypothetical protein